MTDDPPMKPDGLFVRGGKAAARMVGLAGQGASPSRQVRSGCLNPSECLADDALIDGPRYSGGSCAYELEVGLRA
jgi:hypothetical protein